MNPIFPITSYRFESLFLDAKSFGEIAEIIPSCANLKNFNLELKDPREVFNYNLFATMLPNYSKISQLSLFIR
jgi:hypothetical protein